MAAFHHLELWVPHFEEAQRRWDWILKQLGWKDFQDWPNGHSWRADDGCYLVIEQSPDLSSDIHDRTRPGMNHLALTSDESTIDKIVRNLPQTGWHLLFPEKHPYAGGPEHHAAFLQDSAGFELELVAVGEH